MVVQQILAEKLCSKYGFRKNSFSWVPLTAGWSPVHSRDALGHCARLEHSKTTRNVQWYQVDSKKGVAD